MTQIDEVEQAIRQMLDAMRKYVDESSNISWKPADGYFVIVTRAVLRRQFETLGVISDLVRAGQGYAVGPLLRPACEELIWIKYLVGIPRDAAEQLVVYLASIEILDNLKAQHNYAGNDVAKELGLLPHLSRSRSRRKVLHGSLRQLAIELEWPQREGQGARQPSIKWVAEQTGELETYKFIYHATSRFVHFSISELLRRAWGNLDMMSIDSEHYRDYWGHFALYWGLKLFINTAVAITPHISTNAEIDEVEFLGALERIGKVGAVPIITAEELDWPFSGG